MILSRRQLLKSLSATLAGSALAGTPFDNPQQTQTYGGKAGFIPRGTARNLIFINMGGGPSQVDTFDLKNGSWTPDRLGPAKLGGYLDWPMGTMPLLGERPDRFSLIRSLQPFELVHSRGQFYMSTSHKHNPGLVPFIPHLASLLAYELQEEGPEHLLPFGISFITNTVGNGGLPRRYRLTKANSDGNLSFLFHPWKEQEGRLHLLDPEPGTDYAQGDDRAEFRFLKEKAKRITQRRTSWGINAAPWDQPEPPNGKSVYYLNQVDMAHKLLRGNYGTRVVELDFNSWDHHTRIYDERHWGNLFNLSEAFDVSVSFLLDLLEDTPGIRPESNSMLDETLVVAFGEFGRTPGPLTSNGGRDHLGSACSAFIAGGGVQGGRVIGKTDPEGGSIVDPGWNRNRLMTFNDLHASIYSAMGIDFHKQILFNTSGRRFDYVDTARTEGSAFEIEELFV